MGAYPEAYPHVRVKSYSTGGNQRGSGTFPPVTH
jgi:hypothetical protein